MSRFLWFSVYIKSLGLKTEVTVLHAIVYDRPVIGLV